MRQALRPRVWRAVSERNETGDGWPPRATPHRFSHHGAGCSGDTAVPYSSLALAAAAASGSSVCTTLLMRCLSGFHAADMPRSVGIGTARSASTKNGERSRASSPCMPSTQRRNGGICRPNEMRSGQCSSLAMPSASASECARDFCGTKIASTVRNGRICQASPNGGSGCTLISSRRGSSDKTQGPSISAATSP